MVNTAMKKVYKDSDNIHDCNDIDNCNGNHDDN